MKKFLSVMLATAMVVSAIVAMSVLPADAADGDWSIYSIKSQYLDGYTGIMSDIPGYEYTEEGLKMIPAEWKDSAPYGTFQTTDPVYIRDGIYLEVRIDEFSYDAGDKWFNFSLWDQQNNEFGMQGEEYGYGVETLIRFNGVSTNQYTGLPNEKPDRYEADDPSTWAGAMTSMEWYMELEEGQTINCGAYDKDTYQYKFDEQGRPILVFEVKWDSSNDMCIAYINGVAAPDRYNYAITDRFESEGWRAYVGFSLQNNKLGGTVGCTILKYGTCEADADVPTGDDYEEPCAFSNEVAPLADPSQVPDGEPAIRLNGSRLDSNVAGKPSSYAGNLIAVQEDGSVNLTGASNGTAYIQFRVDNNVSYAAEDFPIVLIIMRNFCNCSYSDDDGDGVVEEECECTEQFNTLALAGDVIKEDSRYASMAKTEMWMPVYSDEGDAYTYFIADWSQTNTGAVNISGRIHALRLDFTNLQSDRLDFDICEIAFFRTVDEAEAYFNRYLEDNEIRDPYEPPYEEDTGNGGTEGSESEWEDEVEYPFVENYGVWSSTNQGVPNSSSSVSFTSSVDGVMRFKVRVSSESSCDRLTVYVNDVSYNYFSAQENYLSASVYVNYGDVIRFVYSKDVSVDEGEDTAYIKDIEFLEGNGGNSDDYPFVQNGDVWTSTNQGIDNSISSFSVTAPYDGAMTCMVKVISESGCDVLSIYVNDAQVKTYSGEENYLHVMVRVSRGDTIRFEYSKDVSVSEGEDTAYVKDIEFGMLVSGGGEYESGIEFETKYEYFTPEFEIKNEANAFSMPHAAGLIDLFGCRSAIGTSAVVIIVAAVIGIFAFRKKDD